MLIRGPWDAVRRLNYRAVFEPVSELTFFGQDIDRAPRATNGESANRRGNPPEL